MIRIATGPINKPAHAQLWALRERISQGIADRADFIRQGLWARSNQIAGRYKKQVIDARRTAVGSLVGLVITGLAGMKIPLLLLGAVMSAITLVGSLRGPKIGARHRSPLDPRTGWIGGEAARSAAEESDGEVAALSRYQSEVASIADLVLRASTFDESESQVARRITTVFFLLGYLPVDYASNERTLRFSDGEEEILVRFRHRTGAAVNVTYVERLVSAMRGRRISRGYLFCSPGLSGNAASYAAANSVRSYTLESMTQWIDEVLAAGYGGPPGDILKNIDQLKAFLARISNVLPGGTSVVHGRRRWRRRS